MIRRKVIAVVMLALLVLSLSLVLFACMGETPEEASLDYLLRQGRKSLEIGRGSMAYNYFRRALHIAPNNMEALYGFVLSLDMRVFSFIDGTIDLLAGVFIFEPSLAECQQACARLEECDLLGEAWTDAKNCERDCPFGLQPFMFDTLVDGGSCKRARDEGLEWIIPTTEENCRLLCEDLELCNLVRPPVTFTVDECIAHCPYAYVERHSKCYLGQLGQCNGEDRTCFEHITVGLQLLFREIGVKIPPKLIHFADRLLDESNDYQYYVLPYRWTLKEPPLEINLDGRFDHGFLHFSKALGHGFVSILLMATSVNMEMNFPSFDINFNYGAPNGTKEVFEALIRTVEILLYDPIYPLGFQIVDEPWAYDQLIEGAQELGHAFGSTALGLDFVLNDHDRQAGKAFGYEDLNKNFIWDHNEVLPINGTGIRISRDQAIAWKHLSFAVEANLVDREPFDVDLLRDVMLSLNLGSLEFVVDLLDAWFPNGQIDLSLIFYEPNQNNMRNWLEILLDKLRIVHDML